MPTNRNEILAAQLQETPGRVKMKLPGSLKLKGRGGNRASRRFKSTRPRYYHIVMNQQQYQR